MANKRHKPEEIVQNLRQVDVLVGQGMARLDAIREVRIEIAVRDRTNDVSEELQALLKLNAERSGDSDLRKLMEQEPFFEFEEEENMRKPITLSASVSAGSNRD